MFFGLGAGVAASLLAATGPGRNPAIRGGGFFFVTQPGSAGEPPLVRLRTDTFLRREKCPRCHVRGWCPRADAKRAGCGNFFGAEASPSGGRERSGRHRHTVRDQRAVAKPGPPHVVRIGTDIFRRRGKCPRRRVRCGGTGRSECALPRPAQPAAKGWPRKTGGPRPPPPVGILPKICYNEGN